MFGAVYIRVFGRIVFLTKDSYINIAGLLGFRIRILWGERVYKELKKTCWSI